MRTEIKEFAEGFQLMTEQYVTPGLCSSETDVLSEK